MTEEQFPILGAWIAAGVTLAMYSFLYGDNPFFKIGEHLYIGISAGYWIVIYYHDYLLKKFYEPLVVQGDYLVLIPAAIGLLIFARWVPKVRWLSRWAFAAIMGWAAGVEVPRTVAEYLFAQIKDTVQPLVNLKEGQLAFGFDQVNAILVLVGVVTVLVHFFFSVEHRGPVRVAARTGVVYLMIAFGAAFGSTTMARMSLLYGRLYDLKLYASAEYNYATPTLLAGMIVGLVIWRRMERHVLPPQPTSNSPTGP